MSLGLDVDTEPKGVEIKTWPDSIINLGGRICISGSKFNLEIGWSDFRCMVEYALTNTEIKAGDERCKLVAWIRDNADAILNNKARNRFF